jgi:ribonuclease-3
METKFYEKLYKIIEYEFKNEELLDIAFSHPSLNNKGKRKNNYQRLELLGDSILSFVVVDLLLKYFLDLDEGQISTRKAELICTKTLSQIAESLCLGEYINMSYSEERQGGRKNPKILEDIMESVIGAMYLDGGLDAVYCFIKNNWYKLIKKQLGIIKNPKTRLQEWTQKKFTKIPTYTSMELVNNGQNALYQIELQIEDIPSLITTSKTKHDGEIKLAQEMIDYIKKNIDNEI